MRSCAPGRGKGRAHKRAPYAESERACKAWRTAAADRFDRELNTPLMHACAAGDGTAVHLLLERGADYTLHNEAGDAAIHLATANGRIDIWEHATRQSARGLSRDCEHARRTARCTK